MLMAKQAGVDVIVVDTAHGHAQGVLDRVSWVKRNFPQVEVIGGNIATGDAARALAQMDQQWESALMQNSPFGAIVHE